MTDAIISFLGGAIFITGLILIGVSLARQDQEGRLLWMVLFPITNNRAYGALILAPHLDAPAKGEWSAALRSLFKPVWHEYSGEWRRIGIVIFLWAAPRRDTKTSFKPGFNFS